MALKRFFLTLSMCLILMLSLTACHSEKSYTFQIENGERIKITLDTSDGWQLSQKDGVFTVQKEDNDILTGYFLTADGFAQNAAAVTASPDAEIITAAPEDSPTFYFYEYQGEAGTEVDYLFKVEGAETGVMMGSLSSREEAEAAFKLLEFSKVK